MMPGQISCKHFEEQLDDYLEGELSFGGRMRMAFHAIICRACAAYAAAYEKTIAIVKRSVEGETPQAADETVPEDLVQDILKKQLETKQ